MNDAFISLLQSLYDSEINFAISTFWDGGFHWRLGDKVNGFKGEGEARTIRQAVLDLVAAAAREFPESEFARSRHARA